MQAIPKPLTCPGPWPALPLEAWRPTYETLHMWMQVVGKVCLALTPPLNHFWNIAFRLTPRGLATPTLSAGPRTLGLTFDLAEHRLELQRPDGAGASLPLEPMTVAAFHRRVMEMLEGIGVHVRIWTMPVEVPAPTRFEEDTVHCSYDPAAANAFWRVLLATAPVFEAFRGRFLGKSSPVHFFWGSFDLAVTRFSGRRAPDRPGADSITREAYSHEVISHGFWPGGGAVPEPAFYAYAAPWPPGLEAVKPEPAAAFYSKDLAEFILPYDAVRSSPDPSAPLLAFLTSTYDAAADLAGWPRAALERA
jgi:Family of unknown function (DUF5996)